MKKKSSGGTTNSVPEWVVTFADLMTLLFCFFVLLTTLSTQPKSCEGIEKYLDRNRQQYRNFELRSSKLECILSLPSEHLFKSGEDKIQTRALRDLVPLFSTIRDLDEHKRDLMIVEGHTDNVPIRTRKFSSNWELSSSRATNIATFLVNRIKFPNDRISIRAYADIMPKAPYVDEMNVRLQGKALAEARRVNRRVELILVKQPTSRKKTSLIFDGRI